MKRLAIGVLAAVLVIGVGSFAVAGPYGPSVQPVQAYGGGWGYGPMMGGGYGGYGMGPGMMGGWGYGPGCWGWRGAGYGPSRYPSTYAPAAQPLTKEDATQILQKYVVRTGNPNLRLGEVTETPNTVEGKIVTKDGSLVEKIVVDKATGQMNPVF